MKLFSSLVFCLIALLGCQEAPTPNTDSAEATTSSDSLNIEEIQAGVWVHSTYRNVEGFGYVLSNGIAVASGDEALLIETGWADDPDVSTKTILDEIRQKSGAGFTGAVFTHYHDDSVAGIGMLHQNAIPTYATSQTADSMDAQGWSRPRSVFPESSSDNSWTLPVGDQHIEVFYPGPGHTADNVVVYVPHARLLYGGCLIRPGGTKSLGNTADANIEEWAESVARVRARYGDKIDVVVPSHGRPQGPELLDQTIKLVEEARGRVVGE